MFSSLWNSLTRKKENDATAAVESNLARVLNLFDLTLLGVGSCLGLGVYVLAGSVAYEQAGPAVTISFLIAALVSAIAGFCYAEFAARVPRAGSAYVYSYVSVGEFAAFTIGWNLVLEHAIGTSSLARGLSGYIDQLIDNKMAKFWRSILPIDVDFLADYPDFLSFGIIVVVTIILAIGVKESTFLNNIFTSINLLTIATVIIAGCITANPSNWSIAKENIPAGVRGGDGGFMPYGIAGVMAGAAKCFYGFIGFDSVATTGEEAKNPKRNISLAIVISLIIIFLAYFGVSAVLTMMMPYYNINPDTPFPHAFDQVGYTTVKWIVSIGAIFALCTTLIGALFPLPRVLYAMGSDGVIYKFMEKVHPKTKTPLTATILSGSLGALMTLLFNLHQLIDMINIGTLLAYVIVAVSVLILHYEPIDENQNTENSHPTTFNEILRQIMNLKFTQKPTRLSSKIVKIFTTIFCLLSMVLCAVLQSEEMTMSIVTVLAVIGGAMIMSISIILRQPRDEVTTKNLFIKVPLVPFFPCISIFLNLYLMFQLNIATWIRFAVWMSVGYLIYFTYGIRNSAERKKGRNNSSSPS